MPSGTSPALPWRVRSVGRHVQRRPGFSHHPARLARGGQDHAPVRRQRRKRMEAPAALLIAAGILDLRGVRGSRFLGQPAAGHRVVVDRVEVDAQVLVRGQARGEGGAGPGAGGAGNVVEVPPVGWVRFSTGSQARRAPTARRLVLAAPLADGLGGQFFLWVGRRRRAGGSCVVSVPWCTGGPAGREPT